jgi:uncharacterized cupin superfamily protein
MSDYAIMRAADAPDFTGGSPDPFIGYGRPLGARQIAVNLRVLQPGSSNVPPGMDAAGGHSHTTIEEIYFVLEGEVTVKADDEEVTLGPRDAILLPPGTTRASRNLGAVPAAMLLISVRVEDLRAESNWVPGFWPPA